MTHDSAPSDTSTRPSPAGTRLGELWPILPEEADVDTDGVLRIGGCRVTDLAEQYGTPLHVYDETGLRRQIRRLVDGLEQRRPGSRVLFASKSFPVVGMYALAQQEGLSVDVAGGGELQLALAGGVDPARLYFHGNAKTDAELAMALDAGVGTIIVDNNDEVDRLDRLLTRPQQVLLRIIPGVDAHTHASQATGGHDSKFGLPLDQAREVIARMQAHPLMEVRGVHLHIGSQILDVEQFGEAVRNIAGFGLPVLDTYDVGGGLGIAYTYGDVAPTVGSYLDVVTEAARQHLPDEATVLIEPGRSVVGRAGVTLYRATTVKRTGKTFVAVDGGLADQLDVALTGQRYEAVLADRITEPWTERSQVVGRQCESGDLLVDEVDLPPARVGDLVLMAATGAYSYSLTNNYNGALRPAVVFVADGQAREVVRRETYQDLLNLHLIDGVVD